MADTPQAQLPSFPSLAGALMNHAQASLGDDGCTIITGTGEIETTNDRYWRILMFITAGEIAEADLASSIEGSPFGGITFPAGFPLYGKFKRIKLTSGSLVAYY